MNIEKSIYVYHKDVSIHFDGMSILFHAMVTRGKYNLPVCADNIEELDISIKRVFEIEDIAKYLQSEDFFVNHDENDIDRQIELMRPKPINIHGSSYRSSSSSSSRSTAMDMLPFIAATYSVAIL